MNSKPLFEEKTKEWLLPVLAALISGIAFTRFLSFSTSNIISLLLLFMLYHLYRAGFKIKNKKIKIASRICGTLYMLSFFLSKVGYLIDDERVGYSIISGISYIIGFYIFFTNLTALIFNKLLDTDFGLNNPDKRVITKKKTAIFFFGCVLIMLLGWLPYFLRNYPGDLTSDSHDELIQALGTASLSNHHPIAHTMMIKLFYNIGMAIFNDQTKAIATYSVCQAILLASSFSYLLTTMYKFKVKNVVIAVVLAFYTIVPYNAIYSITMWKDVWFGGIVVVLSTTIWRLFRHFKDDKPGIPVFDSIMIFIFGTAMCLFRSNGLYAYILLVPFLFFIFAKKSVLPAILSVAVLPVALLIKGPVYNAMGVTPPDAIESLSIPAQHIARAIKDGAVLTQDEYDLLSNIVDVDQIADRYTANISDSIKNLVRETDNQEYLTEHKKEFLKLWIDLGLDYPLSYLKAQIDETYGYWYPDVQYWLYAGEFRGGDGASDGYFITKEMKISESFNELLSSFMNSYYDAPYWGLLWSIGTATWVCVFMFGLCFIKRQKSYLIIYIPVLAVLATLMIATPVFAEFRYAYSMYTTIPLLCVVPFCDFKKKEKEDTDRGEIKVEGNK